MENEKEHWAFNKRIPIAVVVLLVLQTVALIRWGSNLEASVRANSAHLMELKTDSVSKLECTKNHQIIDAQIGALVTNRSSLERRLDRIDNKLDRIAESLNGG